MKAAKNKTIDITVEEGRRYLERCITVEAPTDIESIRNKTIYGDTFTVMPYLPKGFVDLLIVDPPYNINKDFHGSKFKKTTDELYMEYTEQWIQAVLPLLKDTATIYVCCDWQSSPAILFVLKKYFHVHLQRGRCEAAAESSSPLSGKRKGKGLGRNKRRKLPEYIPIELLG